MPRNTKKAFFMKVLVVEGQRAFPIDMLRYDNCVPATESDAHLIEAMIGHMYEAPAPARITLRRFAVNGDDAAHKMAEERWRSFGWTVVTYENAEA